ncbi:hypothetical protein [Shewanella aestuarii]|nr:hypothetical protein [Shewanella aestuarii]
MTKFLRENFGLIITMAIIGIVVLGGIYWVEASLEGQVQVID